MFALMGLILLLCIAPAQASDASEVRAAAAQYARAGEVVLAEGPFYLAGREYWIVDFVKKAEVEASIVYDAEAGEFVKKRETMRKVFGVRAMKNATQSDPLFYAIGEPDKIVEAVPYEVENVRNFAAFTPLSNEEQAQLEAFFQGYKALTEAVAQSIEATDSILNPGIEIRMSYAGYPPKVEIKTRQAEERFSYEGFQALLGSYDRVLEKYGGLTAALNDFVGDTEDIPPGTVIREKWGLRITKESILEEVNLTKTNGEALRQEIGYRRELLDGEHREEVGKAEDRLGVTQTYRIKVGIIAALLIAVALLRLMRRRKAKPVAAAAAVLLCATAMLPSAVPQEVPSAWDIMAQQITNTSTVSIEILAPGINESTARQIIKYYPMILKGEEVKVVGPYYDEGQGYYLFDIVDSGVPTGNLIIVEYSSLRMTGSYRIVGRLMKTYLFRDLVMEKPLYAGIDAEKIEEAAIATDDSTLAVFLTRLAVNVREGRALEENLSATPEFTTARELARHYRQAHITVQKMAQLVPEGELEELSQGLSKEMDLLEAYSLVMKYTITDDYPLVASSRYRGRALNRIPMMQELAAYNMAPSKLQLVHDLSTDLFYGSDFCWRLGKLEAPLFVSLPRQRAGESLLEE